MREAFNRSEVFADLFPSNNFPASNSAIATLGVKAAFSIANDGFVGSINDANLFVLAAFGYIKSSASAVAFLKDDSCWATNDAVTMARP